MWIKDPANLRIDTKESTVTFGYEHGPKKIFHEYIKINLTKEKVDEWMIL